MTDDVLCGQSSNLHGKSTRRRRFWRTTRDCVAQSSKSTIFY